MDEKEFEQKETKVTKRNWGDGGGMVDWWR